jgi:cysteine-rich repeat protein
VDSDNDGCDDCAIDGAPDMNNDGFDRDGDGLCDLGDPDEDDDGFTNNDEIKCGSNPEDETDKPLDTDEDGFCDDGVDTDDDNDGLSDDQEDINGNEIVDAGETDPKDPDTDNDQEPDNTDNCPLTFNPNQENTDAALVSAGETLIIADGLGDECDLDDDNDGLEDLFELSQSNTDPFDPDHDDDGDIDGLDNCPLVPNANQLNTDGQPDGGNACDDDDDDDGLSDEREGELGTNPVNPNTDGDAHGDAVDNCPLHFNNDQTNTDGQPDGGDACDDDDDNDGVPDNEDISSLNKFLCRDLDGDNCDDCSVAGAPQTNNDGDDNDSDGLCDTFDTDDDNDGFSDDDEDTCGSNPLVNLLRPADFDQDGLCDNGVDPDDDNDGVNDDDDQAPLNKTSCSDLDFDSCDDCSSGTFDLADDGADNDGDGLCDLGDPDDDNDGFSDQEEADCGSVTTDPDSRPQDNDNDTFCNAQDVCPNLADNQADRDNDGEGDACDCGDFVADGLGEACDDGGVDTADCDLDCTPVVCGDLHVNLAAGEQCDEGNNSNNDDCLDGVGGGCKLAFCGDGFLRTNPIDQDDLEQCDDGNNINGDGCDSNCRFEVCGNGIVQANEQCDDGNSTTDDECVDGVNEACTIGVCGDGIVLKITADPAKVEECDDGNTNDGDGCSSTCQFEAPCFETDACPTLDYREISGGQYIMGNNAFSHTSPEHQVTIQTFKMSRTEVTVGQYRACVDHGPCTAPATKSNELSRSNYQLSDEGRVDGENYPMNAIDWADARVFAEWVGARLPSESEWEYAARSSGLARTYAWGDDFPTCDLAVHRPSLVDITSEGCGTSRSHPVCSRSTLGPVTGETLDGLCDMNGNLEEWCEDYYLNHYNIAPNDGSALDYECNPDPAADGIACFERSLRGGAYTFLGTQITNFQRQGRVYVNKSLLTGFRVVKNY